jgi:hypothetical protein
MQAAAGVTRLMQQCTAMLRDRMYDARSPQQQMQLTAGPVAPNRYLATVSSPEVPGASLDNLGPVLENVLGSLTQVGGVACWPRAGLQGLPPPGAAAGGGNAARTALHGSRPGRCAARPPGGAAPAPRRSTRSGCWPRTTSCPTPRTGSGYWSTTWPRARTSCAASSSSRTCASWSCRSSRRRCARQLPPGSPGCPPASAPPPPPLPASLPPPLWGPVRPGWSAAKLGVLAAWPLQLWPDWPLQQGL